MERLAELISKLKEQFEQKADSSKLLATTLLIERELMKEEATQPAAAVTTASMISVVMPPDRNGYHQRYSDALVEGDLETRRAPAPEREQPARTAGRNVLSDAPLAASPETDELETRLRQDAYSEARELSGKTRPAAAKDDETPATDSPKNSQAGAAGELFSKEESGPVEHSENNGPAAQDPVAEFKFDPLTEIPTLSQQHSVKEINEMIGIRDASLNEKLKENKKEVGHLLKDHPIRDLKKAIGVNDRYVFINELFRGDEVMYERSLKTINGFRIFAEAEYWIERELKVKLGWEEHKNTTRLFYDLIRRRFS